MRMKILLACVIAVIGLIGMGWGYSRLLAQDNRTPVIRVYDGSKLTAIWPVKGFTRGLCALHTDYAYDATGQPVHKDFEKDFKAQPSLEANNVFVECWIKEKP